MMLLLIGCGSTGCDKKTDAPAAVGQTTEEQNELFEAVKPPEGGWTEEEFYETVILCGKKLSYPLNMETFGTDFEFDKESAQKSEEEALIAAFLTFKDTYLGTVTFDNCEDVSDITPETDISTMNIIIEDCEVTETVPFTINGARFGTSKTDVVNLLGDDYQSVYDQVYIYSDRETGNEICRIFFNKDVLVSVNFICE